MVHLIVRCSFISGSFLMVAEGEPGLIRPVEVEDRLQMVYCYVKLVGGVLSTLGAILMALVVRKNSRNLSKRVESLVTSQILFAIAISDLIFSSTGVLTTILRLTDETGDILKSTWHHAFVAAIHWVFEVSSFMWTGTLSCYIITKKRHRTFNCRG